ncbi:MAG: hypothetical protein U1U88_001358 [Lawsonella clevelandensis]
MGVFNHEMGHEGADEPRSAVIGAGIKHHAQAALNFVLSVHTFMDR